MARSGGNDQVVVADFDVRAQHLAAVQIESLNLGQHNFHILASTKYPADGCGNFSRGNSGGRNLVEQRLKRMVVLAVDDCDVDRKLRQFASSIRPAAPGTAYNNTR